MTSFERTANALDGANHRERDADHVLARRAAEGDLEASETLYRNHVDRIYGLSLRMTGNRDAADEMTQAVFVRTWDRIGSYRGESAFSTWP